MRVISLAPSLTETLIESGVEVVGRTRYCIHPEDRVAEVRVVGGTKDIDWDACRRLEPDLVVLDKEENTREMADSCPLPWKAVHITSVESAGPELRDLAAAVESDSLQELGESWTALAAADALAFPGWDRIPGAKADLSEETGDYARVEYVIWRKPWMVIGPQTFIYSMLQKVGFGDFLEPRARRYVELPDAAMGRDDTFYLFSSEPFPFARYEPALRARSVAGAIVDGESYSWYGIRSHRFLRALIEACDR